VIAAEAACPAVTVVFTLMVMRSPSLNATLAPVVEQVLAVLAAIVQLSVESRPLMRRVNVTVFDAVELT
jgi:hypothetical protein